MSLKIGNTELPGSVILAPMAGVSDLPFRLLCHEQGADLVCMEMVSAKAIAYHNRNTEKLMQISPAEGPVSLQLFGSEPDLMAEIAKEIEERPFDILDINMGCPVPKIVGNGEGSALMRDPKLVERIVSKVAGAIQKPVTVKIRKALTMIMSMRWRSPGLRRPAGPRRWRCTAGPESSIIPERRIGRLSAG